MLLFCLVTWWPAVDRCTEECSQGGGTAGGGRVSLCGPNGQVQIIEKVVDVPVTKERMVPMIEKVTKTVEVPEVQIIDKVVDVPVTKARE